MGASFCHPRAAQIGKIAYETLRLDQKKQPGYIII